MSFESFLEDEESNWQRGPSKPFWSLDFSDEDAVLEWLNAELYYLKKQSYERHLNQKKNLAVYRGIQYQQQDRRTRDEIVNESTLTRRSKNPRVVYNHMVDMVEQDVARMTKYRGAVSATPPSDDNEERIVAEIAEDLVEKFWDKIEIDNLLMKHSRRKRIFGEDFIACLWNRNLGPYHPDWIAEVFKLHRIEGDPAKMTRGEIRKIFRTKIKEIPRLPLLDPDTGDQVTGNDGKGLWIDRPVRRGDIEYRLLYSWDMFLQRKTEYSQVEYGFWRERVKVDTVCAQHPECKDKITPDSHTVFDGETVEDLARTDEVEVIHFFHRSTDELDQGRYIKFIRGAILNGGKEAGVPNPYLGFDEKAILPWVRTVDIESPAVLNGDSTVTYGRPCQAVYNNLVSLKIRNRFLYAHPKWFMPKGAAKLESLANQTTVVQYKGATPPVLAQPNLNEGSDSEMMKEAKGDLQQIMGVYGVSRGDPPAGVTAAVALTFLDEQENERANVGVAGHTLTIKGLAQQTLWLMADKYEDEEGRLEDLVGKSRAYQVKNFKMADLRNIAELRIQNATALPQQKSARTQWILDIKKQAPGAMPDDMMVDLLGLGEVERMRNIITVAIRKADDENACLMNGAKCDAPMEQEFHTGHYRVHLRQMNEPSYNYLPKASQDKFRAHVTAHEMLMHAMAAKNPVYLQQVMQEFPGFPIFFVPDEAMVLGNQGDGPTDNMPVGGIGGYGGPPNPAPLPTPAGPTIQGTPAPALDPGAPPGAGMAMPPNSASAMPPGAGLAMPPKS